MGGELDSLFRLPSPTKADIDSFHNDGYIAYPDVLSDDARENLIAEITEYEPVRHCLNAMETGSGESNSYSIRPWNERGLYSDRLIDDPFIASLLQSTIGDDYHFCHSAMNIAPRGIGAVFRIIKIITIGGMRIRSTLLNATSIMFRFCIIPTDSHTATAI